MTDQPRRWTTSADAAHAAAQEAEDRADRLARRHRALQLAAQILDDDDRWIAANHPDPDKRRDAAQRVSRAAAEQSLENARAREERVARYWSSLEVRPGEDPELGDILRRASE